MIQKIYDTNRNLLIFFLITSIMILSDSCATPQRGSYNKYKHYGSSAYSNRRYHYKAKKNRQPIAKNYSIRNTRTSGKY